MLAKFRTIARNAASKILMGLLVLTFAVWGIGDMVSTSGSNVSVATVGDIKISQIEFKRALYYETEKVQQKLGKQFSPEIIKFLGLESQVLQRLVDNRLLVLESKNTGLLVSDEDVINTIRKSPEFLDNNGKFSKQVFEAVLRSSGQSEKNYVEQIREDMAVQFLITTISVSATAPENAAPTLFSARGEQRSIDLYSISPSLITTIISPSEQQLKEYYDANASKFTAPEYRTLSYISFTAEDAKKSGNLTDSEHTKIKDIETIYHERIEEFKKPERRKVERLIFADKNEADKASDAIKSGKTFEQVSKEAKILNPKAISLGVVDKSSILEAAADKVFSLNVGAVSEPIDSPFGWHIFLVTEIIPATIKPLEEVRPFLEKEMELVDAESALTALSNKLEDSIAGGSILSEAAKEFNLKIIALPPVDKNGNTKEGIPEKTLPKDEKFLDAAFKTEEKTESTLIAGKNGFNYFIRVESITPERLLTLEEIKTKLITEWTAEEKKKQLAALSKKIAAGFATASARTNTVKAYSLPPPATMIISQTKDEKQKLPPAMIKNIFSLPLGSPSALFPQDKENGYYIAVVKEIIPAKHDEKDDKYKSSLSDISRDYKNAVQNEIIEQYLRFLAMKYPISVNMDAIKASGNIAKSDEPS